MNALQEARDECLQKQTVKLQHHLMDNFYLVSEGQLGFCPDSVPIPGAEFSGLKGGLRVEARLHIHA